MGDFGKYILAAVLMVGSGVVQASSFSTMGIGEVSQLLARADRSVAGVAVSAKDSVTSGCDLTLTLPVPVTASDLVTKVYGMFDPAVGCEELVLRSQSALQLTPRQEDSVYWLDSDSGFGLDYYGMRPDVCAMVRYDTDTDNIGAADYGYFFLFPYNADSRSDGIREQADFCGSLLQEMADLGLPMDLNTATDDLFEAVGDWKGSLVDVRLLDDPQEKGGRYILILCIEPNAFTPDDDVMAGL